MRVCAALSLSCRAIMRASPEDHFVSLLWQEGSCRKRIGNLPVGCSSVKQFTAPACQPCNITGCQGEGPTIPWHHLAGSRQDAAIEPHTAASALAAVELPTLDSRFFSAARNAQANSKRWSAPPAPRPEVK